MYEGRAIGSCGFRPRPSSRGSRLQSCRNSNANCSRVTRSSALCCRIAWTGAGVSAAGHSRDTPAEFHCPADRRLDVDRKCIAPVSAADSWAIGFAIGVERDVTDRNATVPVVRRSVLNVRSAWAIEASCCRLATGWRRLRGLAISQMMQRAAIVDLWPIEALAVKRDQQIVVEHRGPEGL